MKLKRTLIPFTFLLFYPMFCFPQLDSSKENYNHALQFYIIDEVIVAYKYHFSENSALRFIVNATGLFTDKDSDEIRLYEYTSDSVIYRQIVETIESSQFYEIKFQYLYHLDVHKILKVFFGAGPFVGYQFNQVEIAREVRDPSYEEILKWSWRQNEDIWTVGVSILVGLECTIYDNIKIFTEYEGAVSRGWQSIDIFNSSSLYYSPEYSIDIWTYELKGLRIGLSVYF
jgi:hypothetical protein